MKIIFFSSTSSGIFLFLKKKSTFLLTKHFLNFSFAPDLKKLFLPDIIRILLYLSFLIILKKKLISFLKTKFFIKKIIF